VRSLADGDPHLISSRRLAEEARAPFELWNYAAVWSTLRRDPTGFWRDCRLARQAVDRGAIQKWRELAPLIGLVRNRKLKTVVEIGTARGGTFYIWCKLAGPDATIVSIDLPGGPFRGSHVHREADVQTLLAYRRPDQVLHFLRTDSHSPATLEQLVQILSSRAVDFLFIDGDHTYEGVKQDFDFYSPLVAPHGLIAFHDIVPALHNTACQVHVFWREIKYRYRHVEFVEHESHPAWRSWGGIGVLDWSGQRL
jgi:predicted O-methyltransferase YrrM